MLNLTPYFTAVDEAHLARVAAARSACVSAISSAEAAYREAPTDAGATKHEANRIYAEAIKAAEADRDAAIAASEAERRRLYDAPKLNGFNDHLRFDTLDDATAYRDAHALEAPVSIVEVLTDGAAV
ncbi:MAG: hypothetical protein EKK41_16905 [Hyphomicrobiales bacterium]|nr:MAG: hypothetical protein EKK41_16905 [Hyphomicrobiales bacterium]